MQWQISFSQLYPGVYEVRNHRGVKVSSDKGVNSVIPSIFYKIPRGTLHQALSTETHALSLIQNAVHTLNKIGAHQVSNVPSHKDEQLAQEYYSVTI